MVNGKRNDVEYILKACDIGVLISNRKFHGEGFLIACFQAAQVFLEIRNHAAFANDDRHVFALAALEY